MFGLARVTMDTERRHRYEGEFPFVARSLKFAQTKSFADTVQAKVHDLVAEIITDIRSRGEVAGAVIAILAMRALCGADDDLSAGMVA
jgi:hypothetical protein